MTKTYSRTLFGDLAELLLTSGARRATKYVSPVLTVKATRRLRPRANDKHTELLFTIGKPNYAERRFIKDCIKAGERFPVRKMQMQWFPEKK